MMQFTQYQRFIRQKRNMGRINWPPIEAAWRDTKTSCPALAAMHGITAQTLKNHMLKAGITRNPFSSLDPGAPLTAPVAVSDGDLAALRRQIVAAHRQHIGIDHARLNAISVRLDDNSKLSDKQRLDFLAIIVKVRAQLVDMERKAHSIVDATPSPAPPAMVQVNVNLSPHDAYLQLIGKK